MEKLASGASGLRHLRWGREVLASVEAHIAHNPRLSPDEKEALERERAALCDRVQRLSAAVKPYRDFLERTRVHFRGGLRVARFLCEQAKRSPDAGEEAEAIQRAQAEAYARMESEARRPLKASVRGAVEALRAGLDEMNERLAARFGEAFVGSLYPELARSMTVVADEADEDDDASAPASDDAAASADLALPR